MKDDDNRGDFYNVDAPLAVAGEGPLNRAQGLDFVAQQRVNPEDTNEGNRPMNPNSPESTTLTPVVNSLDGLEHLFATPASPSDEAPGTGLAQAVVYLRVSTPRQLHTAADLDEDGNSIATQRVEALRKVREMKAIVAREFIEPGQSAQTISKRAEFKKLLRYVDENPQVKYVVIYMRSRVFRNFTDAAITKRELLEKGVRLISAKEEFGEGYMADAMEAITDIMNEVQVRMNGEDVKVKMAHKVEQGGSVGRAKLGYLNVRKDYSGRLVNTIDLDPKRAPLVAWAFEQYATGQHSISQLTGLMEEQGLTTRSSPSRAERPVSNSRLAGILRDPYYTGVIRYKGKLYGGRHEPVISKETFLKVQEILDQRNRQGDRDIIHFHYLKGLLYCGECLEAGRRSRLLYSQNTGNGGMYEYFICTAKQRRLCSTPAIRVEQIEAHLARVVTAERIALEAVEDLKSLVAESIDDLLAADRDAKAQLRKQLHKLEAQEERLIEIAADGTLPLAKIRSKIEQTMLQKEAVKEKLDVTTERLKYGAEKAIAYLDLLSDPGELYRNAPESVRRELLSAFFSRLIVYVEGDNVRVESERNNTNSAIRELHGQNELAHAQDTSGKTRTPRSRAGSSKSINPKASSFGLGLSNVHLAGVPGLEPRTTEPESVVLPITPYPKTRLEERADL
jgi:site-specific DNA recombinase